MACRGSVVKLCKRASCLHFCLTVLCHVMLIIYTLLWSWEKARVIHQKHVQYICSTMNIIYTLCNNIDNFMECIKEAVYNNSYTRGITVFSLPYCFASEKNKNYYVTSISYWIGSSLNFNIKYYYQFISYVITTIRCRSYFQFAFPECWLCC